VSEHETPVAEQEIVKNVTLGKRLLRLVSRLWSNPIVLKELRGRMRGWRAVIILIAQLVVLSCFASLIYFSVAEGAGATTSGTIGQIMGQTLFYSTYMLLLVLVVFLSPAFTAGTISGERERKTLDLLITTLLPTRSLVLGKLISALAYMVLLILIALPIQSLALMFGGVIFAEMLIGTLLLLVTALIAGSIGVFISSLTRSSIASTVLTYAAILVFTIGLPIVALVVTLFLTAVLEPIISDLGWVMQAALIYLGGFLLCTNPFAVAVTTKLLEDAEDTLFFFTLQLTSTQGRTYTIPLISPWVVYVLFYVAVSALLIVFSILILKRKRG
jgi:ABC-type transport system involved in multi-copper enzyme maturation permease subunit